MVERGLSDVCPVLCLILALDCGLMRTDKPPGKQ